MLVDDSRISCSVLTEILSKTNFRVAATAGNAREAVEKYREYQPDVVTMDMNLPDADAGNEVVGVQPQNTGNRSEGADRHDQRYAGRRAYA